MPARHHLARRSMALVSSVIVTAAFGVALGSAADLPVDLYGLGQINGSDVAPIDVPTRIDPPGGWRSIAAAQGYALGIDANGLAWSWGNNGSGQLGLEDRTDRTEPTRIDDLPVVVTKLAGNTEHSLALDVDGHVWAWGSNAYGQLGTGPDTVLPTPNPVPTEIPSLTGVIDIAAGSWSSYALTADGQVWSWGSNANEQLGVSGPDRPVPGPIDGLTPATSIAAGVGHGAALSNGHVFTWGLDNKGQLGDGGPIHFWTRSTPGQVVWAGPEPTIVAISAGDAHMLAQANDGSVWDWGGNESGQLGNGSEVNDSTGRQVTGLGTVTSIAAGGHHSLASLANGTAYGWGLNSGAIGPISFVDSTTPILIDGFSGRRIEQVRAGEYSSYFLTTPPDTVAPVVTGVARRAPNASGWYVKYVKIDWTTTDPSPSSGTPTTPATTAAATEGVAVPYTSGLSCDPAGNCATGTVQISLDSLAPTGDLQINGTLSAPPTANRTVTLTTAASDAVSGVAFMRISNSPAVSANGVLSTGQTIPYTPTAAWTLSNGDGQKTVSIQYQDLALNWSPVITRPIYLDRVAPTVQPPTTIIRTSGVFGTYAIDAAGAITVVSSAGACSDPAPSSGCFVSDLTSSGTPGSFNYFEMLTPGKYTETAHAEDAAGNTSPAAKEKFSLVAIQNGNNEVAYQGGWTTVTDATAWAGTLRRTSTAGAKATFTFSAPAGSLVAWVTPQGSSEAAVNVTLDGQSLGVVQATGTATARAVWLLGPVGAGTTHTVVIAVRGTPAAGTHVDVDGFVLMTYP